MSTVVSPTTWDEALGALKQEEDALLDQLAALAARRRELPRVEVDPTYRFQSEDGEKTLAELFNGQEQLVVYHFMYGDDWEKGCPGCTAFTNTTSASSQLHEEQTEYALISRAPIEKLSAWKADHGWDIPWYSGETRFSEAMGAMPDGKDLPAVNVFVRDGDTVYRTYSSDRFGPDVIEWQRSLLSLTPKGDPMQR